jgi:hypothetical protein
MRWVVSFGDRFDRQYARVDDWKSDGLGCDQSVALVFLGLCSTGPQPGQVLGNGSYSSQISQMLEKNCIVETYALSSAAVAL